MLKTLSRSSRLWDRRRGFTLVEILVVSVIFVIITVSLFMVFKAALDSWRVAQAHIEVYQSARTALDIMTRDLSAAYLNANDGWISFQGYAGGATGWVPATDGSEVFFIAALNPTLNDSNAKFELCQVGYWRNSATNELMRYYFIQTGGSTGKDPPNYEFSPHTGTSSFHQKIADNVTSFTLTYYDSAGNTYSTWNSTGGSQKGKKPAKVDITIVVQENNSTKTQTFTTGVCIPQ